MWKMDNILKVSFDTIKAAIKDPLMTAKTHFFMTVARTFNPFMKKYQTDEPVMPFLAKDLACCCIWGIACKSGRVSVLLYVQDN